MKRVLTIAGMLFVVALFPIASVGAASKKCSVVRRISGCSYFMVQTPNDYAVLQWMGGHDPDKDDILVGDLTSFGEKKFRNETAGDSAQIYVEDYAMTRTSALGKLSEKCS